MTPSVLTGALAAFLAVACLECFAVTVWRWCQTWGVDAPTMARNASLTARMELRREILFWAGILVASEGGHDMIRAGVVYFDLAVWPQYPSLVATLFECLAVMGLIRAFTKTACGEKGWLAAAVLPTVAMLMMVLR